MDSISTHDSKPNFSERGTKDNNNIVVMNGEGNLSKRDLHDPEKNVLEKIGLVGLVFPDGRKNTNTREAAKSEKKSFEDKLLEFIHYQPLSSHKAPDCPGAIKMSSPEGKRLFREALDTPYMEAYFTVSPQVDNQPVFCCGSMVLVVALNALSIDPASATWSVDDHILSPTPQPLHYRRPRGAMAKVLYSRFPFVLSSDITGAGLLAQLEQVIPADLTVTLCPPEEWRWNHMGSLSCCTPVLQNPNIILDQLACLAVCNHTKAFVRHVTDGWTMEHFRCWIKMALTRPDMVMVVNHGRRVMGQAGSGHFLPMTGYHEGRDMILSYDIAKHKYVPEWFPLHMMFSAVQARDDRTGQNRGFCLLMRPDYETSERMFGLSLLFRVDDISGHVDPRLIAFMDGWNRILDQTVSADATRTEIILSALRHFLTSASCLIYNDTSGQHHIVSLLELTLKYFRAQTESHVIDGRSTNGNDVNSGSPSSPSIVARCRRPQCPRHCPNSSFIQQIESLPIYCDVCDAVKALGVQKKIQILNLVVAQLEDIDKAVEFAFETSKCQSTMERTVEFFGNVYGSPDGDNATAGRQQNGRIPNGHHLREMLPPCRGFIQLLPEHIATFLLLSWPYTISNRDIIYDQNSFIQTLQEYHLPHLTDSPSEKPVRQNSKLPSSDSHGLNSFQSMDTSNGDSESFRDYFNSMSASVLKSKESRDDRILREQIESVNRTMMAVIDYHNLQ